jgi:hypothetical protein
MPYKDPERKRQWERDHRAQRSAQRKARRNAPPVAPIAVSKPPDPRNGQEGKSFLGTVLQIGASVLVVGLMMLGLIVKGRELECPRG